MALKEESFREIAAVTKQREKQLSAANISVQLLKMKLRELDALMLSKASKACMPLSRTQLPFLLSYLNFLPAIILPSVNAPVYLLILSLHYAVLFSSSFIVNHEQSILTMSCPLKIRDMDSLEARFVKSISDLKMDKEHLVAEKEKLRVKRVLVEERIAAIMRKTRRIADHKGELVDTDVWVGGVMQVRFSVCAGVY